MSDVNTVLAVRSTGMATVPAHMMPVLSVAQSIERRQVLVEFVKKVLLLGTDFGIIPGTNEKPVLMKPGAEKLCTLFGLTPRFDFLERTEDWTGKDHNRECFLYYLCRCRLYRGDELLGEGLGSCNSWEKKYRWRWVPESDVPSDLDKSSLRRKAGSIREPDFAIRKRETGGKYGKPVTYWDRFETAIHAGTARQVKWEIRGGKSMSGFELDDVMFRTPNDDIAEQANTFLKMSQKRAFVAATLIAVNASEFFTQDLDDFGPSGPEAPSSGDDHQDAAPDASDQRDDTANFMTAWGEAADALTIDRPLANSLLKLMLKRRKFEDLAAAPKAIRKEMISDLRSYTPEQVEKLKASVKKPCEADPDLATKESFEAAIIAAAAKHGVEGDAAIAGLDKLYAGRDFSAVTKQELKVALNAAVDGRFNYETGTTKKAA